MNDVIRTSNDRVQRVLANIAHALLHIMDDYAEENAQTGEVNIEIPKWAWAELNGSIDKLGEDPHEVLHALLDVPGAAPETTAPDYKLNLWMPFPNKVPEGWPHLYVSLDDYETEERRPSGGYRPILHQLPASPTVETGAGPGVLEVGLNVEETMVILNHPQIDQDEHGGHILFTPQEASHLGNLLLKKAGECRALKAEAPPSLTDCPYQIDPKTL